MSVHVLAPICQTAFVAPRPHERELSGHERSACAAPRPHERELSGHERSACAAVAETWRFTVRMRTTSALGSLTPLSSLHIELGQGPGFYTNTTGAETAPPAACELLCRSRSRSGWRASSSPQVRPPGVGSGGEAPDGVAGSGCPTGGAGACLLGRGPLGGVALRVLPVLPPLRWGEWPGSGYTVASGVAGVSWVSKEPRPKKRKKSDLIKSVADELAPRYADLYLLESVEAAVGIATDRLREEIGAAVFKAQARVILDRIRYCYRGNRAADARRHLQQARWRSRAEHARSHGRPRGRYSLLHRRP